MHFKRIRTDVFLFSSNLIKIGRQTDTGYNAELGPQHFNSSTHQQHGGSNNGNTQGSSLGPGE